MNRFWGLLFLLVPVLGSAIYGLALWGVAPFQNLGLPRNYNLTGARIDHLYHLIHWIGGLAFVLTGAVLGTAIWAFGRRDRQRARYLTHHTRWEVAWSLAAGAILVFLALYQLDSWAESKLNRPRTPGGEFQPPLVKVVAKRFGWEIFHAGPDGQLDTLDDVYIENELHLPWGEDVVLELESRDVIHSFFVPGLRLKQDVVPGLKQWVWLHATQAAELELVCAELCGWGHYTMQGRVYLIDRGAYDSWLGEHAAWREFERETGR